ncbi:MAG: radical SAM protein, partial [Thermodesulfobacteriota bacterium]
MEPSYVELARSGRLKERAAEAAALMEHCEICPRACGVNRLEGELGFCRTGRLARVAGYSPHFGEESPLVGVHGSGTIFISSCNLLCSFCQNRDISHGNEGVEVDAAGIARI